MDKEKKIMEMASYLCYTDDSDCSICSIKSQCDFYIGATELYNAGYRKADEVRKETAKDIVERVLTASGIDILANEYRLPARVLNEIKRKYGVEVE